MEFLITGREETCWKISPYMYQYSIPSCQKDTRPLMTAFMKTKRRSYHIENWYRQ